MASNDDSSGVARVAWTDFVKELVVVLSVAAGTHLLLTELVSPVMGFGQTGPAPIRTLCVLVVISWLLWRNGETWRDFGLRRFTPWWKLIGFTLGLFIAKLFVFQPVADSIGNTFYLVKSDHSPLTHIHGRLTALIAWLCIAWFAGAFAEEMIFRGYLMGRVGNLLGGGWPAWSTALIFQAALFGLGHAYLGPAGMVSAGSAGIAYGLFYLAGGRNLWPVILIHGIWDTLGLTLIYLNGVPST
jgi:CAAX protease family protein